MQLKGKIALITGAAGGIGMATAARFLEEGASVVLADMDKQALEAAMSFFGSSQVSYVVVDVSNPEQVQDMVRTTVERHGAIDIFVANAGVEGQIGEIIDSTVEDFDKVMAINVRGVWLGLKYVIPVMRDGGGGSILITSSGAGVQGSPNLAPYNTSKHAVIGLMRCAALECAKYNIRVNTVNPGAVDTRMMRSIEEGFLPGSGQNFKDQINAATPLGRYARPDEIASMMLFLSSDNSSYCTGGVYMVDGGNSA